MLQLGVKVEQQTQKIVKCYARHIIEQKVTSKIYSFFHSIKIVVSFILDVIDRHPKAIVYMGSSLIEHGPIDA